MRFRLALPFLLATTPLFLLAPGFEGTAAACGGCFHGPETTPENNTVVTDHRMALAIDLEQTTLYDQIRYQGSPESFAWVLPIRGAATVGVSSDALFAALDATTAVQVNAPPMNCPQADCSGSSGCGATSTSAAGDFGFADAGTGDPSVSVISQATVGPYETVQLRASDPTALGAWLSKNGYAIPAAIQPIVSAYVKEQFDFLAVKLVPGKSVRAMVPIRVTTQGASPQLPLRMVAAGTGANVGITLWVVADGRWEPQNFPSFVIRQDELVWDWGTSSSNFKELRTQKNAQLGGGAWEQESSITLSYASLQMRLQGSPSASGGGNVPYEPVKNENGSVIRTPAEAMRDDLDALGARFAGASRITRLRADLPRAFLATDLTLQASPDQGQLSTVRTVTKEAGEPQCPIYDGCTYVRQGTRSEAIRAVGDSPASLEGGACSTHRTRAFVGSGGLVAVAAVLGLLRRKRRRS